MRHKMLEIKDKPKFFTLKVLSLLCYSEDILIIKTPKVRQKTFGVHIIYDAPFYVGEVRDYRPLAFKKPEASGCFMPVKSVNISI